jgi:glycosyltransferase involved in cell wall biosynthesis
MPNALLLGYDPDQASFRHRLLSLVKTLEVAGWRVRVERFPRGRYGLRTWERRQLLRWADVTVLHQIKFTSIEARLFASFTRRRIFDVDDATYVRKPRRLGRPPDGSKSRRRKFAATSRYVDVVVAGNDVLAGVAKASAHAVSILPTSVDVSCYQASTATQDQPPTIAWIGGPENLDYLEMIRPALARLTRRHPELKVRIICSRFPDWPEVNIERIVWTSATEARSLAEAHIGIMPLTDDEWTRGKCAFKLLQYMAAALPCVASPVGANTEAVIHGFNGFHARSVDEWERHLDALIQSPELRASFGANGRAHVESRYAMRAYQGRYLELLQRLAAGQEPV